MTVGTAAVATGPAFADGSVATTVTVTPSHTAEQSGEPVSFKALVVPATVGTAKFTGTVTWTVIGQDNTVVPCASVKALTKGGIAHCGIAKSLLLGGDAPYTATASYSGDANFGQSSGSLALAVTARATVVKLVISAPPTSGASTVATATVVGGPASALLTGTVVFTVTSGTHAGGVVVGCTGTATGRNGVLANDSVTLAGQVAVCDLPAGWMTVAKTTVQNPKPTDNWSVTAFYTGNNSFLLGRSTKLGTAKV
jgi:hypothetical protein